MICYLPFSYIPQRHLSALCAQLGPITVYVPDRTLVPDQMRSAADEGAIDLKPLQGVPAGQLNLAMQAFKEWADLHQGNLADRAGFFKAARERFPMMDVTNPSQIKTLVMNSEDSASADHPDPLFQAALFLVISQEHDLQQASMCSGLESVRSMQRAMLTQLAGTGTPGADGQPGAECSPGTADLEPGGYMTAARVQAWARLALEDDEPPLVYLTTSPAVIDHLLDLFPEAEATAQLAFSAQDGDPRARVRQRHTSLRCLTDAEVSRPDELAGFEAVAEEDSAGIRLYTLKAIAPRTMLRRMVGEESCGDYSSSKAQTLIGLILRNGP